jgi:hypothetical protein
MQRIQPTVVAVLVVVNAATGWVLGLWPLGQGQLPYAPWSLVGVGALFGLSVGLWLGREDAPAEGVTGQAASNGQAARPWDATSKRPDDAASPQQGEATLRARKSAAPAPLPLSLPEAPPTPAPQGQPVAQIISQDAVQTVFKSGVGEPTPAPLSPQLKEALSKMSDGADDALDALFGGYAPQAADDDEDDPDDVPSSTSTVVAQMDPAAIARAMASAQQPQQQGGAPQGSAAQGGARPSGATLRPMPPASLPNPVEASLRRTGILLQRDIEERLAQRQSASTLEPAPVEEERGEQTSKLRRPALNSALNTQPNRLGDPKGSPRAEDVPASVGRALDEDLGLRLPSLPAPGGTSTAHPDDLAGPHHDLPAALARDTIDRATVVAQAPKAPEPHPLIDEKDRPITARMRVPTAARLDAVVPAPPPALKPLPAPPAEAQARKRPDPAGKSGPINRPPSLAGLPSTKPDLDAPPPAAAFLSRPQTAMRMGPAAKATPSPATNQPLPTLSPLTKGPSSPGLGAVRPLPTLPLPQQRAATQGASPPAASPTEPSQMTELSAMTTLSELTTLAQMSEKSALTNIEQLRATGSAVSDAEIESLYHDYVKALEETGKLHSTSINPTAFSAYIRRERGKVERKYATTRVDMFVRVSQGKPRIVIRPIKPA